SDVEHVHLGAQVRQQVGGGVLGGAPRVAAQHALVVPVHVLRCRAHLLTVAPRRRSRGASGGLSRATLRDPARPLGDGRGWARAPQPPCSCCATSAAGARARQASTTSSSTCCTLASSSRTSTEAYPSKWETVNHGPGVARIASFSPRSSTLTARISPSGASSPSSARSVARSGRAHANVFPRTFQQRLPQVVLSSTPGSAVATRSTSSQPATRPRYAA